MVSYYTNSAEETFALGKRIGEGLSGGEAIALRGQLGAGKTVFVKGLAAGLGIAEPVLSPTFNIVREYAGRLSLYHFDVYRIGDPAEMFEIGFGEYLCAGGVVVVEWAELIDSLLPEDALRVEIRSMGEDRREITIENLEADRDKAEMD